MPLSSKDFLAITDAAIKRWSELTRDELQRDIAALDGKDEFDKLVVQAHWDRFARAMFAVSTNVRRPSTPDEELRLFDIAYGQWLDLPADRTAQDVQTRLEWYKRRVAKDFERRFRETVNRHNVESPIEQIFLMEWAAAGVDSELRVRLTPQRRVETKEGAFQLDFEVNPTSPEEMAFRLAIELDGHEFHERTPEQATRDKRRERAIVREGIAVLRFTGSEVFRNTRACVAEVVAFIKARRAA